MRATRLSLANEEYNYKLSSARKFLLNSHSDLTITDKGSYCTLKGTEISNFFLLPLSVSTQYSPGGQKMDDIYEVEMMNRSHCSKVTISLAELSNHKWLKTIGGCFFLSKSTNYHHILAVLGKMSESCRNASPAFGCTGFHKIGNRWCYAASNLVIYADKLDWGTAYTPRRLPCLQGGLFPVPLSAELIP